MTHFKTRLSINLRGLIIAVMMSTPFAVMNSYASEGGGSCYLQGTYNDFAAAMLNPKGFYFRNDLLFYTAGVKAYPLGGQISAAADQQIWVNMLKSAYVSNLKIFGGTYSAAIVVPVAINVSVNGTGKMAGMGELTKGGNTAGVGDIYLLPFQLNWKIKNHYIKAATGIVVPTGSYDETKTINVGRNYWAFDPCVSYTYLDPIKGHDLSLTSGVMFNGKNNATNYTTGTEFHLDWNIAQYFSKNFGVGFTGYWYQQLTDDKGVLPAGYNPADFKASGLGLGASVVTGFKIGKKDINVIGKWINDVSTKNRFNGNLFMLSFAMKL